MNSFDNSTSISKRAASFVSMAEGLLFYYKGAISTVNNRVEQLINILNMRNRNVEGDFNNLKNAELTNNELLKTLNAEMMSIQIDTFHSKKHAAYRFAHLNLFTQVEKIMDTLFKEATFIQKVLHAKARNQDELCGSYFGDLFQCIQLKTLQIISTATNFNLIGESITYKTQKVHYVSCGLYLNKSITKYMVGLGLNYLIF